LARFSAAILGNCSQQMVGRNAASIAVGRKERRGDTEKRKRDIGERRKSGELLVHDVFQG
jgi:hypothetical protein